MLQKPRRFHRVIAQPLPASSYITARNHRYRATFHPPSLHSLPQTAVQWGDPSRFKRFPDAVRAPLHAFCSTRADKPPPLRFRQHVGRHPSFLLHPARYRPALTSDPMRFKHYVKMPFTSAPFNLHITTTRRKASGRYSSDTSDASDFLNLAQLVERLERRQRIDIDTLDLIPNLHQHGIVELEHR